MKKTAMILCSVIICITLMSQQVFAAAATIKEKGAESIYAKNKAEVIKQIENNSGYLKASLDKNGIEIIGETIMPLYRASLADYAKTGKFKFTEFKETSGQIYLADVKDKTGNFAGVTEFTVDGKDANIHMYNKTSNKEDSCDYKNIITIYEKELTGEQINTETMTAKMAFIDGAGYVCYIADNTNDILIPIKLKGTNSEAFSKSKSEWSILTKKEIKELAKNEQKNIENKNAELKKLKPGENPMTGGKIISEAENNNGLHSIFIIAIAVVMLAGIAVIFVHKKVKGK